jgi:hypothetical protein
MRQLNGVYTQRSNRRHRRVGHIFQGPSRRRTSRPWAGSGARAARSQKG